MYKVIDGTLKVFIGHPGGPFWKGKDEGAWSIPKGEIEEGESDLLKVAIREMKEETGINAPENSDNYLCLDSVVQKSGKRVYAWAFEGDWSGLLMGSSYVEMEYHGGKIKFP